jgi:CDP-glucose 4,6-dehydratase
MTYLMIAERQFNDANVQGSYNVGPNDIDCITTGELVEQFCNKWGNNLKWINCYDGGPHEAQFLKLDCSKLKKTFGWKPRWNVSEALDKTVEWSKEYIKGGNISKIMLEQINSYEEGKGSNEQ